MKAFAKEFFEASRNYQKDVEHELTSGGDTVYLYPDFENFFNDEMIK